MANEANPTTVTPLEGFNGVATIDPPVENAGQENQNQSLANNEGLNGQSKPVDDQGDDGKGGDKEKSKDNQFSNLERLQNLSKKTGREFKSEGDIDSYLEELYTSQSATPKVYSQPIFQELARLVENQQPGDINSAAKQMMEYLGKITTDFPALANTDPMAVISRYYQQQYPDWSKEEIQDKINEQHPFPVKEDDGDEAKYNSDLLRANRKLKEAAIGFAKDLTTSTLEWKKEALKVPKTNEEQIQEQNANFKKSLIEIGKTGKFSQIKVGDFEYKFQFEQNKVPTETGKLVMEMMENPWNEKAMGRFFNKEGHLDPEKLVTASLILENLPQIIAAAKGGGESAILEEVRDELTNTGNPPGNPSKSQAKPKFDLGF